jgi:hypothetical protein
MSRHNPERARIWRELIDAWKQSGQTINAFCRDRKLTRSNFDRWRRILACDPSDSSRGFVHADAYDGYNAVHNNLRHLGCWMHARRYFVEAEPSDPPISPTWYVSIFARMA